MTGIGMNGMFIVQIGLPQPQLKVVATTVPVHFCPVVQLKYCIVVVTA